MKQLVASVPLESRSIARCDKNALDDAIRKFNGARSVTAVDGGELTIVCVLEVVPADNLGRQLARQGHGDSPQTLSGDGHRVHAGARKWY